MGYSHYFSNTGSFSPEAWSRFADEARQILARPDVAPLVC